MEPDLPLSLANHAKQWLAHLLPDAAVDRAAFCKVHGAFCATYGADPFAQADQMTLVRILPTMPEAARTQLLACFQQAADHALDEHYTAARPTGDRG